MARKKHAPDTKRTVLLTPVEAVELRTLTRQLKQAEAAYQFLVGELQAFAQRKFAPLGIDLSKEPRDKWKAYPEEGSFKEQ